MARRRGQISNYELVAKPEIEHGLPEHCSLHLPRSSLNRQGDKSNQAWETRSEQSSFIETSVLNGREMIFYVRI